MVTLDRSRFLRLRAVIFKGPYGKYIHYIKKKINLLLIN